MWQSKMLILSTKVDKKSLETEILLPFVAQLATNGNQKQFLAIFDLRSSIVKSIFDCGLSGVIL